MSLRRLASVALLIAGAESFMVGHSRAPLLAQCRFPPLMQTDDMPGDVEDVTTAPAAAAAFESEVEDEGSIAKQALMAEMSAGLNGPLPDKAAIGEILLALEARNPTDSPATSPLLNAKWKVLYATGASPALKALMLLLKGVKQAPKSPSGAELVDVQDSFVTIAAAQPRVQATTSVRVLSVENTVTLQSKLEAESAVRLLESYASLESEWPTTLKLPFGSVGSPVNYRRSVLVTYLDEDMLVLRDSAGRPDVLMRADADTPFEPFEPAEPAAAEEEAAEPVKAAVAEPASPVTEEVAPPSPAEEASTVE